MSSETNNTCKLLFNRDGMTRSQKDQPWKDYVQETWRFNRRESRGRGARGARGACIACLCLQFSNVEGSADPELGGRGDVLGENGVLIRWLLDNFS